MVVASQLQLPTLAEEIVVIHARQARAFIVQHHYMARMENFAPLCYGLYRDGILDGVFVFSLPLGDEMFLGFDRRLVVELARCVWLDKGDRNTGSRTIAILLARLRQDWFRHQGISPELVVSYCDTSRHTGTLYRACNFIDAGLTDERKNPTRVGSLVRPRQAFADRQTVKRRYVYPLTRSARKHLMRRAAD